MTVYWSRFNIAKLLVRKLNFMVTFKHDFFASLTVVERVDNSASLFGRSILQHNLCFLVKKVIYCVLYIISEPVMSGPSGNYTAKTSTSCYSIVG